MTESEATQLAISCLLTVLNNDLEVVAFTATLRRGIQKWLDNSNGNLMSPDQAQSKSFSLVEKGSFPGLDAFLFHANGGNGLREVLVGVDEANWVSEFAFVHAPEAFVESYLRFAPHNPWFHVSSFSTKFKLDGLLPFESSGGIGGNRMEQDRAVFNIKVPAESWQHLAVEERERILDELEPIALGNYWLNHRMIGTKQRLRIAVIKSRDTPGDIHTYVGDPPQQEVLADRFVVIPAS